MPDIDWSQYTTAPSPPPPPPPRTVPAAPAPAAATGGGIDWSQYTQPKAAPAAAPVAATAAAQVAPQVAGPSRASQALGQELIQQFEPIGQYGHALAQTITNAVSNPDQVYQTLVEQKNKIGRIVDAFGTGGPAAAKQQLDTEYPAKATPTQTLANVYQSLDPVALKRSPDGSIDWWATAGATVGKTAALIGPAWLHMPPEEQAQLPDAIKAKVPEILQSMSDFASDAAEAAKPGARRAANLAITAANKLKTASGVAAGSAVGAAAGGVVGGPVLATSGGVLGGMAGRALARAIPNIPLIEEPLPRTLPEAPEAAAAPAPLPTTRAAPETAAPPPVAPGAPPPAAAEASLAYTPEAAKAPAPAPLVSDDEVARILGRKSANQAMNELGADKFRESANKINASVAASNVVDKAIPPTGDTAALNKLTQSKVNFALQKGDPAGAQEALEVAKAKATAGAIEQKYPVAGSTVDGRTVRPGVPNTSSIEASLDNYEQLPKVREVPFSAFDEFNRQGTKPTYTSATEKARTQQLAEQIKQNGEISPLIVAEDKDGPYILEGGHRFDALRELNAKSFPAVVVKDLDSLEAAKTKVQPEAAGGSQAPAAPPAGIKYSPTGQALPTRDEVAQHFEFADHADAVDKLGAEAWQEQLKKYYSTLQRSRLAAAGKIPQTDQATLRSLGYAQSVIDQLKPAAARDILEKATAAPSYNSAAERFVQQNAPEAAKPAAPAAAAESQAGKLAAYEAARQPTPAEAAPQTPPPRGQPPATQATPRNLPPRGKTAKLTAPGRPPRRGK